MKNNRLLFPTLFLAMLSTSVIATANGLYVACPVQLNGVFKNLQSTVTQGGYNWEFIQLPFSYSPTTLTLSNASTNNHVTLYVPSAAPTIVCQGLSQGISFQFSIVMPQGCPFHKLTNSYHVTPSADGAGWTCN